MRVRYIIISIVILIIVMAGYSQLNKKPDIAIHEIVFEEPKEEESEIPVEDRQKLSELTRESVPNGVSIPRLDEYRQQALNDPHHTPKILVNFARTISPKIEAALLDIKQAEHLWPTLVDCIDDNKNQVIPAAAALCLSAADRIAIKHPAFKVRFQKLKSNAGTEAKKLYESSELVD